ncbi:hypothetical protein H4Q26_002959 [Puccinia striiformis f. sp. tritici PST-130]|nr:hypothetical protein H4Q26_002959 [Puccinia striiformis f. sp. tritici PST-130]
MILIRLPKLNIIIITILRSHQVPPMTSPSLSIRTIDFCLCQPGKKRGFILPAGNAARGDVPALVNFLVLLACQEEKATNAIGQVQVLNSSNPRVKPIETTFRTGKKTLLALGSSETTRSSIAVSKVEEYVEEEERKAKPSTFTFSIGSGSSVTEPGLTSQNLVSSSTTSPVFQGLLGIGKGPTTFEGIMAELPKCIQIKACLEQFEYHRAWMRMFIITRSYPPSSYFWNSAYEQIQRNFSYTDQRAQAHWLAILFAVCGLGLFNNVVQSESDLRNYELPTSVKAQRALALRWCRAATSCLEVGNFEAAPSVDSVAAMAILAQLPLYTSNGETLGLALDFIGKAIDLAVKLDLHIDPDLHPVHQHSTALVKQNRRRLMIALLCQHYKMGGLLCQEHGLRPLEQFSGLELPLDQFDEDYDPVDGHLKTPRAPGSTHTIMTGVRCRFQVSRIWQEIGIMFSNPAEPPTHESVLEIHTRLKEVESEWPETIRTQLIQLLAHSPRHSSYCRPARPANRHQNAPRTSLLLRKSVLPSFSSSLNDIDLTKPSLPSVHTGSMLAIHRAELFPLDNVPIQFFVLSSTISLAVYCLTDNSNDEEEKCETVVRELERVKKVLKRCTAMSSILRRTYAVLDFALNKWARMKNRTMPVDGGPRKRTRLNSETKPKIPDPTNFAQIKRTTERGFMENLLRSLLQDHPWPDHFELNHDTQRKHDPAAYNYSPSFQAVPQTFDFANLFELHASEQPPPPPAPHILVVVPSQMDPQ